MQKNIDKFREKIDNEIQIIGPMDVTTKPSFTTPTIIVDGGLNHQYDFENSVVIGDGDSINDSHDTKNEHYDILLKEEKDFSDLSYGLSLIDSIELNKVSLYGFLGGRKDHEFINILEACKFLSNKKHCTLSIDDQVILYSEGNYTIHHHGTFSVTTLEEAQIVLEGDIKYPYKGLLKKMSSHGLSNESTGKIHISNDNTVIFFKS